MLKGAKRIIFCLTAIWRRWWHSIDIMAAMIDYWDLERRSYVRENRDYGNG